ncbi:Tn5253 bacteriocine putative [Streptococcus pneumoniae]|nr:hypothetical protein [Streptococcus pneumoniae]CJV99027.1 Tn5253 bacteriocine putative [Streptococcus pneumoniae]
MKVVNLYDLKQMGNKGGCTIQLIHHFPFGMGLGHLKKDYIEFKRVGIFDGKAVEVTLREPYSRDLLQVVWLYHPIDSSLSFWYGLRTSQKRLH